jgi:hypothetical protein
MTGGGLVLGALLLAMVMSELSLRGTKLQTALGRVLVVWGLVFLAGVYPLLRYGATGPLVFLIFWGGAFASWFGVRSHIESSILLRMVYLLRSRPMVDAELLGKYASHYGQAMRMAELFRGGLAVNVDGQTSVTPKGMTILRVVSKLRSRSAGAVADADAVTR